LLQRCLPPCHCEHARAVALRGFDDAPPDPAACADHDHVLSGQ
jgi:hypothetical protein